MRTFLMTLTLVSLAFAGCIDDSDGSDDNGAGTAGYDSHQDGLQNAVPGLLDSHPAYGYLTQGTIPMTTDGQTRVVNEDGTISWFRPAGDLWTGRIPASMEVIGHTQSMGTNSDGEEVPVDGHGIAVFGPLAFYGGVSQTQPPLIVVDINDPANPVEVGRHEEVPVRDADTILYPDGRLVVISSGGLRLQYATDVTDPALPELLAETETPHGNHNIAVVPGTPIVYNSGGNGFVDIMDYSDPANPVNQGTFWNGHGCHDITFFINQEMEKYRAYCAASNGDRTQIWDIADPLIPRMIYDGPFPGAQESAPDAVSSQSPINAPVSPVSIDHLTMVNHDATILIMGDETGGGGVNGCDFYYDTGSETYSGPHGNLWFYDISDETNPVLLSHVSPEAYDGATEYDGETMNQPGTVTGSCTSHFGRLVEDTGFLVMGFYSSGVLLIDFTDPSNPVITDRMVQGGSVWDVWYQDGYLYTGDSSRGMDVLKLV